MIILTIKTRLMYTYLFIYIYVMGKLQIWWNFKFPYWKLKLEFPLGGISIGVSPSGNLNIPSGNSNYNLPWGNLNF